MTTKGRPTIKDVAQAAGVSATTVSHALNGKGTVNAATIGRVQEAAQALGYRASPIARGLQQSRLGLLALVIRPLRSLDTFLPEGVDYFLRVAGAASLAAMEHGYSMILVDDPTRPDVPFSALAADAYIVTEPFANDPVLTLLAAQHIPFVTVGIDPARPGEFVEIDDAAGPEVALMLDHLHDQGATQIALVTGTDQNSWNLGAHEAFHAWVESHDMEPLVYSVPEVEGEHVGEAVMQELFDDPEHRTPDAVFCLTGRHAWGVIEAASARGLRVPEDLLVAAGSGTVQGRTSTPSVTSLDLHPEEIAREAVAVAVKLAERQRVAKPLSLPPSTLNVRESTMRASEG